MVSWHHFARVSVWGTITYGKHTHPYSLPALPAISLMRDQVSGLHDINKPNRLVLRQETKNVLHAL